MQQSKQQEKLVDILQDMYDIKKSTSQDDYIHPEVLFGSKGSTQFVNTMLDEPPTPTSDRKIYVLLKPMMMMTMMLATMSVYFLSCPPGVKVLDKDKDEDEDDEDERNKLSDLWYSTTAPALGYDVSHTVIVSLCGTQEVQFDVATCDIESAAIPLGDIAASLSKREDLKCVVFESSVTEETATVPFGMNFIPLLRNKRLIFEAHRVHVSTVQQQDLFFLSRSSLVFRGCCFESEGYALFGNTLDKQKGKRTRPMRVSFFECMPLLEILLEALKKGFLSYLELNDFDFSTSTGGVEFFQELLQQEALFEQKGDKFKLMLGRYVKLTLGNNHKLCGGKTIREKLGKAVSSLLVLGTCMNTLLQRLHMFRIHFFTVPPQIIDVSIHHECSRRFRAFYSSQVWCTWKHIIASGPH